MQGTLLSGDELSIKVSREKIDLKNEIISKIKNDHFLRELNFTEKIDSFVPTLIDELDTEKDIFTLREVINLKNAIAEDSVLSSLNLPHAFGIINTYFNNLIDITNYQISLLQNHNFKFEKDEFLDIFEEDNTWLASKKEIEGKWFKKTKNDLLTLMLSDIRDENTTPLELLEKRYANRIRRIYQRNEEDYFSIIINTFTKQFDPHSAYLSPKNAEDFDMQMSLSLEGIGALLGIEDDYAKIVSLVPGGPADKSNELFPDDRIVSIRQADEKNRVDVVGWRIDEIVRLIRGEAGTNVELEILSSKDVGANGSKLVILQREEVKLEEQAAKSKVFKINSNDNEVLVGIIELPAFYIDFNAWRNRDPNFRSSSKDVEKILNEFNKLNVDVALIDLRGNSGGSLYEANKVSGLFLSSGATVQVKESSGRIRPWGDGRAKRVWKNPVAVLVDRYSASASEIFAGAIQDYERGIVIGYNTFGKGTVQRLDDLSAGQIKITESKFYRVNGSSTQSKGIVPDISLPSTWDITKIGESSLSQSLPWDAIRPIRHKVYGLNDYALNKAKENLTERYAFDPNLTYLSKMRNYYDLQENRKMLSLNLKSRSSEKFKRKEYALTTENLRREQMGIDTFKDYKEMIDFQKTLTDEISLQEDILLNESVNILVDYFLFSSPLLISSSK